MKGILICVLSSLLCGCACPYGRSFQDRIYPEFHTSFEVESKDVTVVRPQARVAAKATLIWNH